MESGRTTPFIHLTSLLFLFIHTTTLHAHAPPPPACVNEEQQALLHLKQGLIDDYGHLSSWTTTTTNNNKSRGCCTWQGVTCNSDGHITSLNLHSSSLSGTLSSSLTNLTFLQSLDLSFNSFDQPFPSSIPSLSSLLLLNLSSSGFKGHIPPSLSTLSSLQHLDLSFNNGLSAGHLTWLSSLSSLQTLNLTYVDLSSSLQWPLLLSNLSLLQELRLSQCGLHLDSTPPLPITNGRNTSLSLLDLSSNSLTSIIFTWIFSFRNTLTHLDISSNSLEGNLPSDFGSVPHLLHLDLSQNGITGFSSSKSTFGPLCNLTSLSLSYNPFTPSALKDFKAALFGCAQKSLQVVDLTGDQITGSVIDFRMFTSLRELYLGNNLLNSSFPQDFLIPPTTHVLDFTANDITGSLRKNFARFLSSSNIRKLYLGNNLISGGIEEAMGRMGELEEIVLNSNRLEGRITEAHFFNLSKLRVLDLSSNSLTLSLNKAWVPPFQLNIIVLRNCSMGPGFPTWLRTQTSYSKLDISFSNIEEAIPEWFSILPPTLHHLNISWNRIPGPLPNLSSQSHVNPIAIDFTGNLFTGQIQEQLFPTTTSLLNLSKNKLSGSILFLCLQPWMLLRYLDLSSNQLSDHLPSCWSNTPSLVILHLENNNFTGTLPPSISNLLFLESLHLRHNSFHGHLPPSLKNCTTLKVVDIGENKFTGNVKEWMGEGMGSLLVLSLRDNMFTGSIPSSLCTLPCVQIIDLSQNQLSGKIPSCLGGLSALAGPTMQCNFLLNSYSSYDYYYRSGDWYMSDFVRDDEVVVVWKRRAVEYTNVLARVKGIDLSSNKLTGGIPRELVGLVEMVLLNLSRNKLEGSIPRDIGHLVSLDSLDLSLNNLVGVLPSGLADINTLSVLDVSENNLSGSIPVGTQLQSFGADVYEGNPGLCGAPLRRSCGGGGSEGQQEKRSQEEGVEEEDGRWSLYVSVGLGFGFGFWSVCAPLLLNNSFSVFFFKLLMGASRCCCCCCCCVAPAAARAVVSTSRSL